MRPILLQGHVSSGAPLSVALANGNLRSVPSRKSGERPLAILHSDLAFLGLYQLSLRYSRDGDIIFSTAKDQIICAWFSANGERLGTYSGHQGALWSVDVDSTTTLLASGAADNTMRLWEVRTGKCLKVWDFNTAVKRVEFSEDGTKLLGVTEKRMGHLATIVVFDIVVDVDAEQADDPILTITCEDSKATVVGWSFLRKYIIAGHEDGSVSQWDAKVSILIFSARSSHMTAGPRTLGGIILIK